MILEIFKASIHSVGTATTMTVAGVYLHRKGMITSETKTGMARYTQQIAIPALFFTKIVDCPQNFSHDECPNILNHLKDAWVLLIWPFYVLMVGLLVGKWVIRVVQPPQWQHNCVLAATAFANAMGMPITLLDVIGMNFQPPGGVYTATALDPSMFQSIYVILNPVLQWGLGGWLLSENTEPVVTTSTRSARSMEYGGGNQGFMVPIKDLDDDSDNDNDDNDFDDKNWERGRNTFTSRRKILSFVSLEDAGYDTDTIAEESTTPPRLITRPSVIHEQQQDYDDGLSTSSSTPGSTSLSGAEEEELLDMEGNNQKPTVYGTLAPPTTISSSDRSHKSNDNNNDDISRILHKIASKALQPPALGAMAGFVVASYPPLRGLFVDLENRADNAPLEWIFDGILALAKSAIPVNMCVVGVNLHIASQRKASNNNPNLTVHPKTIAAVVLSKMLLMPLIGVATVWTLKRFVWQVPPEIQFQFYLVLLMNFVTPTANVVMVIAELGSGPHSKNVMASLIGWQYVVAPVLLSLTVMMIVYTAAMP